MTAWWVTGDSLDTLRAMPDDSVDLVLTSPPFLALRSYLPADHPDKKLEGGSQATPAAFVDWLLSVVDELGRVLAPHGTLAIELGDTFSGSGGAGGDYDDGGMRDGQPKFKAAGGNMPKYRRPQDGPKANVPFLDRPLRGTAGWPLDKSLSLVPEAFRLSLAYGRNVLGGEWVGEPWRVRNVVRWCRPNPPVGALGDKFRPATTDVVVACRSRSRWFDLDAVRTETDRDDRGGLRHGTPGGTDEHRHENGESANMSGSNPAGAPPKDYLELSTEPYKGSHYATWPRRLVVPFVESMCPSRVCRVCGEPSRRIVGEPSYESLRGASSRAMSEGSRRADGVNQWTAPDGSNGSGWARRVDTLGWTDCECTPDGSHWRPGRVLDPFAGSGTTLQVATGHGRDAIGIDLDERNLDLARERVGMWLTETTADELAGLLDPQPVTS